jgi:hypothetical protein
MPNIQHRLGTNSGREVKDKITTNTYPKRNDVAGRCLLTEPRAFSAMNLSDVGRIRLLGINMIAKSETI